MEFLLFTSDTHYAQTADEMGVDALIVDWEQPRVQTPDGELAEGLELSSAQLMQNESLLSSIRALSNGHLICRVNNAPKTLMYELEMAMALGADEILLPMVRTIPEIENCLKLLTGNTRLGIMAETPEILSLARELEEYPLTRVFFGLLDYQLETGKPTMFTALLDGDIDTFRDSYSGPFGVAGITDPHKGFPIRQKLLLAEMVRLDCSFAVGRKTFERDVPPEKIGATLSNLHRYIEGLKSNAPSYLLSMRQQLMAEVRKLTAVPV